MSVHAATGHPIAGPATSRHAFLKKTALLTFVGLLASAVIATASTAFVAPVVYRVGGSLGGMIAILGTFFVAHVVARGMVYGSMKVPGLVLAIAMEGISLGFLLLTTILYIPGDVQGGFLIIAECMALTAATAGGMLVYVWFNKSELSLVKAGLSMLFVPMLILMAISWAFPIGGTLGIIISAVFVVVSAAGLLYRLNMVVHELEEDMHLEAAYEITMGILVLFWNLLTLLNRLRR